MNKIDIKALNRVFKDLLEEIPDYQRLVNFYCDDPLTVEEGTGMLGGQEYQLVFINAPYVWDLHKTMNEVIARGLEEAYDYGVVEYRMQPLGEMIQVRIAGEDRYLATYLIDV